MSRHEATKISLDKNRGAAFRVMATRGLPKQVLSFKPFTLEEQVSSFISEVDGLRPKRVKKEKQLDALKKVLDNPFYAPYVLCLSGKPHDMAAKLLAAFIMARAVELHMDPNKPKSVSKRVKDRTPPVWHTLVGGFDNPMIHKDTFSIHKPSLIIISNITPDSTNSKFEKLRDILEVHSTVPRIVVAAGVDPLTLFHSKLRMNLNACAYLTNSLVKKAIEV